jgi:hypothetical protein
MRLDEAAAAVWTVGARGTDEVRIAAGPPAWGVKWESRFAGRCRGSISAMGMPCGVSTAESQYFRELEQASRELKRVSEIVNRAASFFGWWSTATPKTLPSPAAGLRCPG